MYVWDEASVNKNVYSVTFVDQMVNDGFDQVGLLMGKLIGFCTIMRISSSNTKLLALKSLICVPKTFLNS